MNNSNQQVALKRTMKAGTYVSRELEMLCRLRGVPNTVQLLDFFYSYDARHRLIQNSVMEFCETNLENILINCCKHHKYIDVSSVKKTLREICIGL